MPNSTEDATAAKMVRLGYALDDPTDAERVLDFRATFNDPHAAFNAIEDIGGYNDFEGGKVAQALAGAEVGMHTRIAVGREGSPVIYVGPFFDSDDEQARIMEAFRATRADEVDFDGRMIRAWWD